MGLSSVNLIWQKRLRGLAAVGAHGVSDEIHAAEEGMEAPRAQTVIYRSGRHADRT